MRCISHIRKYSLQILQPVQETYGSGLVRELVPMFVAQFRQGDLDAAELEFAERRFGREAHGRTLEMDQVTLTPLLGRLSVFDTDWDETQRTFDDIDRQLEGQEHRDLPRGTKWKRGTAEALTIEKLTKRAVNSDAFAIYEEAPLAPPWPAYDAFPGDDEELFDVLVAQAHHLPQVLAYERQNQKRTGLIARLEEEIERTAPVGPEVVLS